MYQAGGLLSKTQDFEHSASLNIPKSHLTKVERTGANIINDLNRLIN